MDLREISVRSWCSERCPLDLRRVPERTHKNLRRKIEGSLNQFEGVESRLSLTFCQAVSDFSSRRFRRGLFLVSEVKKRKRKRAYRNGFNTLSRPRTTSLLEHPTATGAKAKFLPRILHGCSRVEVKLAGRVGSNHLFRPRPDP